MGAAQTHCAGQYSDIYDGIPQGLMAYRKVPKLRSVLLTILSSWSESFAISVMLINFCETC